MLGCIATDHGVLGQRLPASATLESHAIGATDNDNIAMLCKTSTMSDQQAVRPVKAINLV
jgi:hypothetical protein